MIKGLLLLIILIVLSLFSYEIQEEGPVQQISYVSDKEQGYIRIVSLEEEADYLRLVHEEA